MRVVLFVHCFFPDHFYGTETYTLQLAKNLIYLGHEVTVVCGIFQGEQSNDQVITAYTYDGVKVIAFDKNHVPHSRIAETYFQEETRPYLRQILEETKPDVVHVTHLVNHTAVLLEEVVRGNIPLVATLTDFYGFCFNNKLESASGSLCAGPNLLRSNCIACYLKAANHPIARKVANVPMGWAASGLALSVANGLKFDPVGDGGQAIHDIVVRPDVLKRAYTHYDAMIAPSRFLLEAYGANGFDRKKLHLSRFGVDIIRRPKPIKDPQSPISIGYIGQIAPHKGVDLLVSAVRDFTTSQARLDIYGPANQDVAYMQKLRSIAGSNVQFRGTFPPSEMAEIMSSFDLLAIPSTWYENSPLVLLNALASHTPVIVSDVQGLTEFIEEGISGWSFKRSDANSLKRLLAKLLQNRGLVRANSLRTTYDRTSLMMTQEVVSVYEQVKANRWR
ncbi:Glycosyltransferase Family 4 [Phyllobacterium sp. YR620]|uniref:glycosyltransferase family 4 protein n=1 Tax=Phyllobacterium sp. YR620 TaxID=1881066 RepID=UPI00088F10EA|nr:glycosyltransferase family 4 protein [Phyllobacterium sp. YR620]SDP78065.1 Glycosyltransferase Family 4 [Phyllobacterium sp. YR620]